MTAYSEIELERQDGIATIRLNRPQKYNAITRTMLTELVDAFETLTRSDDIRVAVLTGNGKAFAAGVDLTQLEIDPDSLAKGDIGDAMNVPARRLNTLIEDAPFPVIAKVNGACFTGALEIALACDWIVAAETALFGDTHAKLGIRPTWGMTARLAQAVGLRRARELSFTARTFNAKEAADWGLVTTVVAPDELDAAVDATCAMIAGNSPGSLAAYKSLYRAGGRHLKDEMTTLEAQTDFPCPDAPERIEAFIETLTRGRRT
uniref:enoyl-CoA hydratase/isomerase family protein n=1 Tax=Roseovarius indicus TaxID=540747 RepID=UPI003B527C15